AQQCVYVALAVLSIPPRPPTSPLFPYTTLFRSLAHLAFGARRAPGRSLVRVFNPEAQHEGFESVHTLVMTVTDDMPFLVDSLGIDRKSTRLNSSHVAISYAVFCLKKKKQQHTSP